MNDPRITLPIARLAADPQRKQASNGTPYLLIRVAATGGHMDKNTKQWVDHDTMWATIFEYDMRLAETYERMLRKGTPVRVEGVLKWKTGTDNQGQPRTDFIMNTRPSASPCSRRRTSSLSKTSRPATSGREPTRSARPTQPTRPTTNGTCSKWQ